MNKQQRQNRDELLLTIETSDKRTLDRIDFAFRHAMRAVDNAAEQLASDRANWHDDPENDAKGYANCHAPADKQFPADVRAAVVLALFRRCERIRKENILNEAAR